MKIIVKLFASLRKGRFISSEMDVKNKAVVGDIVEILGIEKSEVGIIFLNSRHATFETNLNKNDSLSIFPLVGGG